MALPPLATWLYQTAETGTPVVQEPVFKEFRDRD
jgi:hypothetical protein